MTAGPVLVLKFGGTSVATPEARQQLIAHVHAARSRGRRVAIVVSAMGRRGEPYATDTLLDLLRSGQRPVDPRDYDFIFTCGEAIAAAVVSHEMKLAGVPARALSSLQAGIRTDGSHMRSEIVRIDTSPVLELLARGVVPVVTGGQGVAEGSLEFTTLGRGGSDTSGVALGVALGAERVEIFTDVEGIAVTDPRLVPGAPLLQRVSYGAMSELARFGAGVVHPLAVAAGWAGRIPMVVRSTFTTGPGTAVDEGPDESDLVGMARMPALDTLVLPHHAADNSARRRWERCEVATITDRRSGSLIAGAKAGERTDFAAKLADCGITPTARNGTCAWLSLVGSGDGLVRAFAGVSAAFAAHGIDVLASELQLQRCTFVVPAEVGEVAAKVSYDAAFSKPEP